MIIIDNNSTLDKQSFTVLFQLTLSTCLLWFDTSLKVSYIWNVLRTHSQVQTCRSNLACELLWVKGSSSSLRCWDASLLYLATVSAAAPWDSERPRRWKKHLSEASPASLSHWCCKSCSCCERLVTDMPCWCSDGSSEHPLHLPDLLFHHDI